MGGGGDVSKGYAFSSQPVTSLEQPTNVIEMVVDVRKTCANRHRIWIPEAQEALHDFLTHQLRSNLCIEFLIEPGDEAAHLRPFQGLHTKQRRLGVDFVKVFADGSTIDKARAVIQNENRHLASWVQGEKFMPAFPNRLHPHIHVYTFFGKDNADFAAERR